MPGAMTNTLNILFLIFLTTPQSKYYYPHLTDKRKDLEKLNKLPMVTQLEVDKVGFEP